jgi:hypothetical protein
MGDAGGELRHRLLLAPTIEDYETGCCVCLASYGCRPQGWGGRFALLFEFFLCQINLTPVDGCFASASHIEAGDFEAVYEAATRIKLFARNHNAIVLGNVEQAFRVRRASKGNFSSARWPKMGR